MGSNAFFLGACHVYGFLPKAIYDRDLLIGFTCFGYRNEHERYELISIMLGHQFQGKGYGIPILKMVVDETIQLFDCKEIYLTVIHNNEQAKRIYEKIGFRPTGEIEKTHHDEWVYCLKLTNQALLKYR